MSINTSSGPSRAPEGPRNAKAEAKAAKAYAKAMRPWYKKKRVMFPLGLVVLSLISAVSSSGKTDATASAQNASTQTASTQSASMESASPQATSPQTATKSDEEKSGTVGQALTNAGTTYKVTSVRTTATLGDPKYFGERADGKFVVVGLELTNNKDETKTFLDSSATIKTADGNTYETSDKAVLAFGDDSLMLKEIHPDLTTRGKLAFDLPPSKLSGSTLVIEDLYGDGEIQVDLGL